MKIKQPIIKKHQQGLSLIELMISMTVGLFLLAGIVTSFVSTQDNDRVRDAVSEMDANAAYALRTLRQTITHTGYGSTTNNISFDKPFLSERDSDITSNTCIGGANGVAKINEFKTKDAESIDAITVIYMADNPCANGAASCASDTSPNINDKALLYTDCSGGGSRRVARDVSCSTDSALGNPAQAQIYNTFSVVANDERTMMCHGSRGGTQSIVDNVHAMQFLYGVRDEGTNSTAYRTADEVDASDRWGQVVSVKVGLLMRSSAQFLLKQDITDITFKVLDQDVEIPEADRRRLFRLYTSTINLENLNKEPLGQDT